MIPHIDLRLSFACVAFVLLFALGDPMAQSEKTSHADDSKRGSSKETSRTVKGFDDLKSVLVEQADAWNRGDIDEFMKHYWKSDRLTFSSGGKTTRGWATTKQNYKKRYPTRERMGELTFDKLEFFPLGDSVALVLGHWHLQRNPEPVGGNFSLVFRKIDGRWVIIHDHTSVAAEPKEK